MADIYAFPKGAKADTASTLSRPAGVPDEVWSAVESVHGMRRENGVRYREIPVPSTMADYGIGVEFECGERAEGKPFSLDINGNNRMATGWIMVLYSNETRPDWASKWRCVAFARMPLEANENNALTPGMYWEGMCDYLEEVNPDSVSGTVTITQNTAFGTVDDVSDAGCEVRVSWTPLEEPGTIDAVDAGSQVESWAQFLKSIVQFEEDATR